MIEEFKIDTLQKGTYDKTECTCCGKTIHQLTKNKSIKWYDKLDELSQYISYCETCYKKYKKQEQIKQQLEKCFEIENYRNNKGF